MWRDDKRAGRGFLWLSGVLIIVALLNGWAQSETATPQVTFLEPPANTVIPTNTDVVTIRFRLSSPDGTNLMRYQPFIDGYAGNDPIPIDPPSPEVELALAWQGVRQFPDGVHTITIRVVDAKGREGSGSLRLIKGQTPRPSTVDIVAPQSGSLVRGTVMILIRACDDKGLRGLVVRAKERATSRDQSIYTGTLRGQKEVEVQVRWDTTVTHPQTGEPLFPDGVYLLQAWVVNEEGQRTFGNEVLVIVQNKVAQPVLSQATPAPPPRGGATVGMTSATATMGSPLMPTITMVPLLAWLSPIPTPTAATQPQWAPLQGQGYRPYLRLRDPSGISQKVKWLGRTPQSLPEPQMVKGQIASRPSPYIAEAGRQHPQRAAPNAAVALPLPSLQTVQRLSDDRRIPAAGSRQGTAMPEIPAPPRAESVSSPMALPSAAISASGTEVLRVSLPGRSFPSAPAPPVERKMAASLVEQGRYVVPMVARVSSELPAGRLIAARLPEPKRSLPYPDAPHLASPSGDQPTPQSPRLQPLHGFRYTAIAGDTLQNLAERFGVSPEQLAAANDLPINAPLRIGQRLWVPAPQLKVWVDGHLVSSSPPAFLRDGIAVGSFRAVVEASGGKVSWDNSRKQAMAILGQRHLLAAVGKRELIVDGERLTLPLATFLLGNRTFLPLRALGQALGKQVQWQRGGVVLSSPE